MPARPPARRAALLLLLAALAGCTGGGERSPAWAASTADVVGPEVEGGTDVRVDLYLDATTSMEGYATPGSTYGRFLDALESSITAGWREADVRFYRFGTRVDSVGREAFLSAKSAPAFYRQPGLFETTNIDSVLARTDPERVSVVVTDLFQSDGDTNALVAQVKERAFARGLDAAVLAIPSEFDGRVYDAPGGTYEYASTAGDPASRRPFYALMFGRPANIGRLFETLRTQPFVDAGQFTVVSPYVVDEYAVSLRKAREARDLNVGGASDEPNTFAFNLRPGGEGGRLEGEAVVRRDPFAPDVNPGRLELVAYRRVAGAADSARVRDFTLREPRWSGDTLRFAVDYRLAEPAGRYSYLVVLQVGSVDGLRAPAWVGRLSSEAPSAASDANRTLNLAPLVSGLLQARTTLRQPRLAQFVVNVRKS